MQDPLLHFFVLLRLSSSELSNISGPGPTHQPSIPNACQLLQPHLWPPPQLNHQPKSLVRLFLRSMSWVYIYIYIYIAQIVAGVAAHTPFGRYAMCGIDQRSFDG